jgi:hypothetical protein
MSNRRAFFPWIAVCFTVLPTTVTAQEPSHSWHFRGDLGGFLIHKDETGIAVGAHLGRRLATWRPAGLPQDYADMLNWEEQVVEIARVYHELPTEDRERAVILTSNYGEAGSIDFYRPRFGLPPAVAYVGTYWFFGPGALPGTY